MERFGRYVLLERIACGGMAEVFRAASLGSAGFTKLLAVKRILPHLAADQACVTMLIDEAKIASTLDHPNILQVLDLGKEKGTFFIAMEFVAGQSLNTVVVAALRKGFRLPLEFCFHAVAQATHGLSYAHQKTDPAGQPMNIVHRDVSPQNIMVAYDGSIKLADFGIAKAADRSTHTKSGTLKGKAAYMAPEQVEGRPIDQRVDIYAMGVVLHELIAMRRLRRAESDAQILFRVARGEFPKFDELGLEVPEDAAQVVYRALAPNPDDRWPDAQSFVSAMDGLARHHGWHWNAASVAAMLKPLFPEEMAKEKQAQAYHLAQMSKLAEAAERDPGVLEVDGSALDLAVTAGALPATDRTQPNLASGRLLKGLGLAAALLVAAGAAWLAAARPWATVAAPPAASAGQVVVETEPPGATILLGGKPLAGVSPLIAADVPAGPVEVEARARGRNPVKQVVDVTAGGVHRVRMELSSAAVEVPVTSKPPGATVTLDGRAVGQTPTTVRVWGPGPQRVRVELAGFAAVQHDLVAERAPASLDVVLEEARRVESKAEPRAAAKGGRDKAAPRKGEPRTGPRTEEGDATVDPEAPGKLTLQSVPWARIIIDGKDTGRYTPVAELSVPPGKHTVKLVNDEENLSTTFQVVVKPGSTVNLSKELR
jgi:hypothetical protein